MLRHSVVALTLMVLGRAGRHLPAVEPRRPTRGKRPAACRRNCFASSPAQQNHVALAQKARMAGYDLELAGEFLVQQFYVFVNCEDISVVRRGQKLVQVFGRMATLDGFARVVDEAFAEITIRGQTMLARGRLFQLGGPGPARFDGSRLARRRIRTWPPGRRPTLRRRRSWFAASGRGG